MSVTRLNLVSLVNAELENYSTNGFASTAGDGTSTQFRIAPNGYHVIEGSVVVTLDDVSTAAFTVDSYQGVLTLNVAPALGVVVNISFQYAYWSNTLVLQAINAGLNNLFPSFYSHTVDSTSVVGDGSTTEFPLAAGAEFIVAVDNKGDSDTKYTRQARSKYDWYWSGPVLTLRFYAAPSSGGGMRVRCINRPAPLLADGDDLLTKSGIPERAQDCIISYACYYLLTQKIAPRVRSDIAVNTIGVGTLSPRQINDAIQAWMSRFQFQLAATKMPPWMSR